MLSDGTIVPLSDVFSSSSNISGWISPAARVSVGDGV